MKKAIVAGLAIVLSVFAVTAAASAATDAPGSEGTRWSPRAM